MASSSQDKETGTTANSGDAPYQVPWVEKFRPRSLDDVLGNEDTVQRLRAIAKDGNMPNLILSGPPGTGVFVIFLSSVVRAR